MSQSMSYQEAKDAVLSLYHWSENFLPEQVNPFCLFFDLIGKSEDEFGAPLCSLDKAHLSMGYKEAYLLGKALCAYSDHPLLIDQYASELLNHGEEDESDA